ncbi:TrmH family RNA methyltransferase [Cellulomonas fimi]|uniref:tRNA/rRNA methyltransferase (SpoU) n=1 Tax=Cellulomonas fimi (strain ATCC 484 / DSM 20113 / JCM 1341 / CCUG 24087 / LMG 16345 / NBRC 15513 / NCIMB 8980 / NCTC 7547 / NRS-133) TaxID=590998 RepID=F4H0J1_CELFA|nr:TrmH family RNA methyltransferase [Cellulomonas fimi]AEE47360.1 tRNA/rRNA methyltransferase (SpoU) [Cellulomonas fimi ATCC 484]NNH05810.1 RNA methyltransferase [Cellulomonas fimi]VEH36023.1 tRNA (guanosine(18)-2'-O)-methyltransferase [Cellulomonas fimi]
MTPADSPSDPADGTPVPDPGTPLPDDGAPVPEVGVGPWPGGPGAWPRDADGGLDPRYDPELLAHGDRRNVVDRYRYWTVEAVVADLDTRRHTFHVAIENWQHDLNIGSVVRTANAFLAAEVHVVGRRRWNRRGAMVTDRYQHLRHHPTVDDLLAWASTAGPDGGALPVLGIDNLPGSVPLEGYPLPRACVLLLGQESVGLSDAARAAAVDVLHIAQFGSTRSINAGAAAAIAMHAWVAQHAGPPPG